ncbi:MAG: bifunctional (p)ppGpp synthetase/guanosine-3',5'-bis(diphosphate) 3'-pyrophosphohydrolase [Zoogloeaceae bacterium]|jgi:GTP pyrophosphokinase/guanosine-3',5'-bis(diphosphate) 3'-pyrophosphohydrolase|nr:bifunctional (p)ppGpp synthetase/guanosine-3',5'-bis(diphosphate) 3'-pyrophosphohydrolase [Zoogloeaceae bacterium]
MSSPDFPIAPPSADHLYTISSPFDEDPERCYKLPEDDPTYLGFVDSIGYLPPEDVRRVKTAVRFADWGHQNDKRQSGEPYIIHPLCVAITVVKWQVDADVLCAALLHDLLEDTDVTKEELAQRFGAPVAELVDGLTKLDRLKHPDYHKAKAESLCKLLLATARDWRVMLIKLADRQHNLQTMSAIRPEKRRRIAQETLDIYAPIANLLGLHALCTELQNMAQRLIHPWRTRVLEKSVQEMQGSDNKEQFDHILERIRQKLEAHDLPADNIVGRPKSLYSIYRKMKEKHLSFKRMRDLYGFRVIVREPRQCYLALGALHELYVPIHETFKDYIAEPKENGYQSLHTSLRGPNGLPVEVQIRTEQMDRVAEEGVAVHPRYKGTNVDWQLHTHKWLRALLDMQGGDPKEFLENVKIDLFFPKEIFVYTPKGEICRLPRGATPVDFAYAIHTDIGHRCRSARINGDDMPLSAELKNGDTVEIITDKLRSPNLYWLNYVKTGNARTKIRHFLRTTQKLESAALGERLLKQELHGLGLEADDIPDAAWDQLVSSCGKSSRSEIFTDIGLGQRLPAVVAQRLLNDKHIPEHATPPPLIIHGTEGTAVELAQCCQPIPGDPIIGSIVSGKGLVVHTHDCPVLRKMRSLYPNKWIDVAWADAPEGLFEARLDVLVYKEHREGVAKVISNISETGANIEDLWQDREEKHNVLMHLALKVSKRDHLAHIERRLRRLPCVIRVRRVRGAREHNREHKA